MLQIGCRRSSANPPARHTIDHPQLRDQPRDVVLGIRASRQLEGRGRNVTAKIGARAACAGTADTRAGDDAPDQGLERRVRRNDAGKARERRVPVESARRDLANRLRARLGELGELDVRIQPGRHALSLAGLGPKLCDLRLLIGDPVRGQRVHRDERDGDRQRAEQQVHRCAGASTRAPPAGARVAGDEVDGFHAATSWTARPAAIARLPGSMSPIAPECASLTTPDSSGSAISTPSWSEKPGMETA